MHPTLICLFRSLGCLDHISTVIESKYKVAKSRVERLIMLVAEGIGVHPFLQLDEIQ